MRKLGLVAAVALAILPAPALAWGKTGHRVIGALADQMLTTKARAGIVNILGTETLAEASNWPDFMRSDPSPFWQTTASPWHYVTVPVGKTYADVGPPSEGDALTALKQFADKVRNPKTSLADKQLALRFIVHIVGDLSQPLHVGRGDDKGGNDVRVTWFGKPTNLHAVWDSALIDDQQLSYTEYAAFLSVRLTPLFRRQWSGDEPLAWVADSAAMRETVYPTQDKLGYEYVYQQRVRMEEQLEKGGVRLAAFLNALFR